MRRTPLNRQSPNKRFSIKRHEIRFHPDSGAFYLVTAIRDAFDVRVTLLDAEDNVLGTGNTTVAWLERETEKIDTKNKFSNVKTRVNGELLDSKLEADRYTELLILERAGQIKDLQRQVRYKICLPSPKTGMPEKVCTYVADFVYEAGGKTIVEDPKGRMTEVFKMKQRLMRLVLGIEVRILTRKDVGKY